MTVIFGNGSIVNLNNIHSIEINNDLERVQLVMAINAYDKEEGNDNPADTAGSDESISESDLGC